MRQDWEKSTFLNPKHIFYFLLPSYYEYLFAVGFYSWESVSTQLSLSPNQLSLVRLVFLKGNSLSV
jgi:hypothetical protein